MAVLLLLSCCPCWCAALDLHTWQWQRAVLPSPFAGEQCVVLDAELYAHAAPGLRDVRLLQQGHEVPYALEESFDEPALNHAAIDRAVYTTVLRIPLQRMHTAQPGSDDAGSIYRGTAVLPAHVPVERMQLESVTQGTAEPGHAPVQFSLSATPLTSLAAPDADSTRSEQISDTLAAAAPVELTALGANLQNDAKVSVAVDSSQFAAVVLQMRQRLLCFQPLTTAPMAMLFGSERARPVRYDFSTWYRPLASPVLGQLGSLQVNPAYRRPTDHMPFWTARHRVLLVCSLLVIVSLLVGLPVLADRS